MTDQQLNCVDCKGPFIFTEGEQSFFSQKGFSTPRRCKPCRDIRKAQKERGEKSATVTVNAQAEAVWRDQGDEDNRARRRRR